MMLCDKNKLCPPSLLFRQTATGSTGIFSGLVVKMTRKFLITQPSHWSMRQLGKTTFAGPNISRKYQWRYWRT